MLYDIITWLLSFFPGFDRFIPGLDRFIPGFDRFIPASIPVTGTLPLQSKCTLVNKICIVLYLENISFYLIWKKYFLIKRKKINSQIKYFPEKYNWHQSKAFPVSFQCHMLSTVIHRQWQESVKCCKQHAYGALWNSCCTNQLNWIYHEMLSRHGWSDST